MRRSQRLGLVAVAAGTAWVCGVLVVTGAAAPAGAAALPQWTRFAVLWSPLFAVLVLGLYMFVQLVWGVATFRSCPEEADALRKDIERARRDLAARGFKIPDSAAK